MALSRGKAVEKSIKRISKSMHLLLKAPIVFQIFIIFRKSSASAIPVVMLSGVIKGGIPMQRGIFLLSLLISDNIIFSK